MKRDPVPTRRTAVVVGASMAGLSAAAVLSSRFDEIVIVERDLLPGVPAVRRGVPQGRHAHALLAGGSGRLEGWFPGLTDELVADGARHVDIGHDVLWHQGGLRHRFPSGVRAPVASRELIEHHVRRRTLALPNVTLRTGVGGAGVTVSADGGTVTGLSLDDGTTLPSDLVVDASGRAARSLRWLSALGFEQPPTSIVHVDVAYATRMVRRDPSHDSWWTVAMVISGPPAGRLGVVIPVGDDRWMVTLCGVHGDHPPLDGPGFLDFARSLPSPELADVLEAGEALTEVTSHRIPSSQRRHPERMERVPAGLVLVGDSLCSFNPTYGQGMSTAALQAEALGRALDNVRTLDERFVRAYYRQAGKAIAPAWQLTTGADFTLPATTGPKPPGTDVVNRYMPSVLRAGQVSEDVARRFIEVTSLIRPPSALMTPRLIAKVLLANRRVATVPPVTVP